MKRFCLLFSLIFVFGCGVGEQPLVPTEDETHLEVENAVDHAPKGEIPTIVIRLSHSGGIYGMHPSKGSTRVGSPMKVFVVENGLLTVKEVIFQDSFYYLLIPTSIDDVFINQPKNHGRTYINVLDNRIRLPTSEDMDQVAKEYFKELGKEKDEPLTIQQRVELGARYDHITPINSGDEIIFVNVIRNLTRPHIEF